MAHIVIKEDYCPPECFVFTYTVEKNIMSGFETIDWEEDPDEIG